MFSWETETANLINEKVVDKGNMANMPISYNKIPGSGTWDIEV